MKAKVVAPSVGESITEVRVLAWKKNAGDMVKPGEVLLELETDKATVEVAAETAGAVEIVRQVGETVPVGELLGYVDDAVQGKAGATPAAPAKPNLPKPPTPSAPTAAAAPAMHAASGAMETAGPAARKMASEMNIDMSTIQGTGKDGRVTKGDLLSPQPAMGAGAVAAGAPAPARAPAPAAPKMADKPGDRRVPMTMIRQRIAQRLLEAQNTAAILTTFNEVDMTEVMKIRNQHKESFKAKHGVPLSFMSFFSRACVLALKQIPSVNAFIDGTDVVYHDYVDMGIAVGTDRGLVVPVIRGIDKMSFVDMEKSLGALAEKARANKLSIAEMTGGTFTITNGGTYGSLLSTPILNTPQSGILGMHNIVQRPVAVDGKVEIRPMMYLALSYDHRIIDGKEAVTFLVAVRDALQAPEKLGMDF